MLRVTPILLAVLYGLVVWRFSAWSTARALNQNSSELADPALKPVLDKLARALDLPRIRLHIYEIEPVNGLAAPDGRIFITRGFYAKFLAGEVTGEELASVIAHELGHVALGHARRRMIDFSGQNAIRAALMMTLGRLIPGLGPVIVNTLTSALAARLSRSDEFEADEYAAALLTKAGIGTAPQITLFEKLGHLTGARGSAPAWLLSHPKTADRIKAIEAHNTRWKS